MTDSVTGTANPYDSRNPPEVAPARWPGGWYPDPTGAARLRWWDGRWWTTWTSDGHTIIPKPITGRRYLVHEDIAHLRFINSVFLPEMTGRAGMTADQAALASRLVWELSAEASGAPPPELAAHLRERIEPQHHGGAAAGRSRRSQPASATEQPVTPGLPASPESQWATQPPGDSVPLAAPAVRRSRLAIWWSRTGASVRSDLAVHGIAYLGVLLFFVGAFGLVAFAFGDVRRELRPVAEILIALLPFGAAYLLMRRGAVIVGRALEVVGGLTAPLMLITSFLDAVAVPPDPQGPALVISLTLTCAAITCAYALWVSRHPASGLRFVVAPMAWLTVAMATLGLGREIPRGEGVAAPASAQVAATLAALVASVALARRRPEHSLASPTISAATPGSVILAILALLTWFSPEGATALSGLACAILVLAALELLSERFGPPIVLGLIEPIWWCTAVIVIPAEPNPRIAVGFLGFLALLDLAIHRGRPLWSLPLPVLGALFLLLAALSEPWLCVALLGTASAWAHWRRLHPWSPASIRALDAAAGILPLLTLIALGTAASVGTALAFSAGLVLAATVPARRPLLRRTRDDMFWPVLWRRYLTLAATGVTISWLAQYLRATDSLVGDWGPQQNWNMGSAWLLVLAAAGLAVASASGPMQSEARPWAVVALVGLGISTTCLAIGAAGTTTAVILTALTLPVIVWVHVRPSKLPGIAAMTGLAAHFLALCALTLLAPVLMAPVLLALALVDYLPDSGLVNSGPINSGTAGSWALVASLGMATAGWLVTTLCDDRDRSPIGRWLSGAGPQIARLPGTMCAVGLSATLSAGLSAAGVATAGTLALALSGLGLLLSGATWLVRSDRVGAPAAWAAFLISVAAIGVGWREPTGRALCLSATALIVLILPARRRATAMVWTAWTVPAPLVATLAGQFWPAFPELVTLLQVAIPVIAVGGAMTSIACAVDLRHGAWLPRLAPRRPGLIPPFVIGSIQVAVGAALAAVCLDQVAAGWCLLAVAVVMLALAALLRVGLLAGTGIVVGWGGVPALLGGQLPTTAWPAIGLSVVLLGAAELAHRSSTDRVWLSRWDLPLLTAAAFVALTALISDRGSATAPLTQAIVGFEAIAVAVRARRTPLMAIPAGATGILLILQGAVQAGGLWPTGALMLASGALTGWAVPAAGVARLARQLGGAACAAAAWGEAIPALDLSARMAVDLTCVGAGAIALLGALLLRWRQLDRSWACTWSGVATVVVAIAVLSAQVFQAHPGPSSATVAGMAMVSLACFGFAFGLPQSWVGDAGVLWSVATLGTALSLTALAPEPMSIIMSAISALCAALLLIPPGRRMPPDSTPLQSSAWRRWVAELGVIAAIGAIVVATSAGTPNGALVLTLAVAAMQAAAVGSWLDRLAVQQLSPILGCAAVLTWIDLVHGSDAAWSISIIGLSVLVMVALWRHNRVTRNLPVAAPEIVGLELLGLVLLVGPTMWNTILVGLQYAIGGMLLGVGLAGWGVLTRVRRRLIVGVAVVLANAVLLLAVPAVDLLPALGGAWAWVLIAVIGVLALLIAALLEEGRAAVRHGAAWFTQATTDWE